MKEILRFLVLLSRSRDSEKEGECSQFLTRTMFCLRFLAGSSAVALLLFFRPVRVRTLRAQRQQLSRYALLGRGAHRLFPVIFCLFFLQRD